MDKMNPAVELFLDRHSRLSDTPALRIRDGQGFRCITHRQLAETSGETAQTLMRLGINKGDRVAILSENRPEWAVAFLGILACGAIVVPIDAKSSETELSFILKDSRAGCLFVSARSAAKAEKLKPELTDLRHIIPIDGSEHKSIVPDDICSPLPFPNMEYEQVAVIVYTSGTTGTGKGVELTVGNLLFQVKALRDVIRYTSSDRFLSILPLNHMLELTGGLLGPLHAGACVTYSESVKPTHIFTLMKEDKTTIMICVPLVLKLFHGAVTRQLTKISLVKQPFVRFSRRCADLLRRLNIRAGHHLFPSIHDAFGGRLRCFVCGGAPLDSIIEKDFDCFGLRILQGYGLTETAPVVSVNTFEQSRYGSVGKPLPGVRVKIISEGGTNQGEIATQGPHVMRGYHNNAAKTAEVLRDGWFHTGDIGYLDADGFLFISGRIRNLIVLGGGKKVFPEELEAVMAASPLIQEICVLGKPAKHGVRKGCEEVYAVVVPNMDEFGPAERTDRKVQKERIASEMKRLGKNLAGYKNIMDFEIWENELPKTATRKIKRKDVADRIRT